MAVSFRGESDFTIKSLINRSSEKAMIRARTLRDDELFCIEPYIDIVSFSGVYVGFRIGSKQSGRMYVIKDLRRFASMFERGEAFEYGNSCVFAHDAGYLDAPSRRYARFIQSHAAHTGYDQSLTAVEKGVLDRVIGSSRKYVPLVGYVYDEVFELFRECGQTRLKVRNDSFNMTVDLLWENPQVRLKLMRQEGERFRLSIDGEEMSRKPSILTGGEHIYVWIDDTIYCCDREYSAQSGEIITALCNNWRGLNVAKDDLQSLSSAVLKPVKHFLPLLTDASTLDFEAPPLVSRLYLDMQADNFVTARLMFHYGNRKHDAFMQKDLNNSPDLKGEYDAEALVSRYFPNIDKEHSYLYIDNNQDALFELVNNGLDELNAAMEVYATERFKGVSVKPAPAINVGVRINRNLIDLDVDIEQYTPEEIMGILTAYRQAQRYYRLKSGSFVSLEEGGFKTFFELVEGLDISDRDIMSGQATLPLYRALYLDSLIKRDSSIKSDRDPAFKKIVRDIKYVSDSDFAVPPSLAGTLRSYQKDGYRWMRTIGAYGFGGILADDMGLGKTLQVITLLLSAKLEPGAGTAAQSLVVCPASLILNWISEFKRFAPQLDAVAVLGTASEREALLQSAGEADVIVTSYDLLKRDIELYEGMNFLYEIIDEAQYIKNHTTQNALAVKSVKAGHRLALTGTPVENSLAELWSIYDFLMPGYLYSYNKFKRKFEVPVVRDGDKSAMESLRRLVSPFILRRMKADVLKELPPRIETTIYATLEGEQRSLYNANVAMVKQEFDRSDEMNSISILAMLTKLRQICCEPSLAYEDYAAESAKLSLCMELIQNCIDSGHKLLLFSQFTSMLKIIENRLAVQGIRFYKITGSTRAEDRLNLVNSFNSDDTPVFLISLKAGGTGLNLTGADVVIHYDPWWNIAAQNQATDRAHRIGQRNSVQIYKLIAKDTIEEKIQLMQVDKANLADAVLTGADGTIARMSKDDILDLFT